MMLREGRDVKNVTVVLGLRPFTAAAEIWRSGAARRYQRTNLHNKSRRFRNELPEKCKRHRVRRIPIGEFLAPSGQSLFVPRIVVSNLLLNSYSLTFLLEHLSLDLCRGKSQQTLQQTAFSFLPG